MGEAGADSTKATGWKNGWNGLNGSKRIFPPAADKDEPQASQSPFQSVSVFPPYPMTSFLFHYIFRSKEG